MPKNRHRSLLGGQELALMADTERPAPTGGRITTSLAAFAHVARTRARLLLDPAIPAVAGAGATAAAVAVEAVDTVSDVATSHGEGSAPAPTRTAEGGGAGVRDRRTGRGGRRGTARGSARGRQDEVDTTRIVALVDMAKDGDAEAFGQLYDHYLSTIYRYVYYRVGTHALAEDLTSETFLRALRALSTFRWQGRDFGAWLVTIARNLIADHYKSGRFRLEVVTGEILDHDTVTDGPEDDVLAALTNETLMQALGRLGHDQQECLVLRFLNGLSVAETARALGKTDGAIKQLQLRAIRNLAKFLPKGFR